MGKAKKKEPGAWKRMARCMDIPEYALGQDECVEILGGNTVRVEGAKGIHTYEPEIVKLHMKENLLVLRGSNFNLNRFANGCLQVCGALQSVSWEAE